MIERPLLVVEKTAAWSGARLLVTGWPSAGQDQVPSVDVTSARDSESSLDRGSYSLPSSGLL